MFASLSVLLIVANTVFAQTLDPKNDPNNYLGYIASPVPAGIACALFLNVALAQTWFMRKWGAKWMLAMTIAAYFFSIGLITRIPLHYNPDSKMIFLAQSLLIVLSPAGFIAADYVLLGQIADYLGADSHVLISRKRLTLVFVLSDVITFLIQCAGGGMTAGSGSMRKVGFRILQVGLAAQLVSFFLFTLLYLTFLLRVWKFESRMWAMDAEKPWRNSWKALATALLISCIGILIRSAFRVAEMAKGFHSSLSLSETLFYLLDTLPLFIAIVVYVPFWPGRILNHKEDTYNSEPKL